ncbi:MAG: hypothetical protein PHV37_00430 [Candidatus Gastranaerophilales bacterium]|nr:hypothetical protein [Candidatus Gastranaerophilales bacterium]
MKISAVPLVQEKTLNNQKEALAAQPLAPQDSGAIKTSEISSKLLQGAYGILPAKTAKSSVSFGANPIYDVNLRQVVDGVQKLIPANFSELIIKNEGDEWAMLNVQDIWKRLGKTDYADCFADNFIKRKEDKSYFVTELKDAVKELQDRITCLIETTNPKKTKDRDLFEVKLLQASPKIANKAETTSIKGSGEMSLYGAVRQAKEHGFSKVGLLSTNNSFYNKMGFSAVETYEDGAGGWYELPAEKFDEFLDKIAKKYKLN